MSKQRTLQLDHQHNIVNTDTPISEPTKAQKKIHRGSLWTGPGVLLRLEGLMLLTMASYFYAQYGAGWLFFGLFILAPDLSMVGYIANPRVGAIIYNIFHTYVLPTILIVSGIVIGSSLMISLALIWFAHIGMDRLFGYGLKYMSAFKNTHLNRV
ncbi:MAG: DUF4260 family protein [Chloroflexi bacterium AL-W]|nr:DUF4260 family protein [Chloroflexi bacterium AL-N1]NOK71626.1 DUF4260 family protein [Chloroflexi bacterium AL-N10]NOK78926.1 DUF4260 family protein [Chloroflexi bacterium AL-N5]NOK86401.1 DUF4260 family protein [Chloroflexi bacterium AL-W]